MSKLNNHAAIAARKIRHIWVSWEEFGCGSGYAECEQELFINMVGELAKDLRVSFRRAKEAVLKHL